MIDIKKERRRRWIFAGSWTALIYATLYSARPLCEFLKQFFLFPFIIDAGIIVLLAIVIGFFLKKKYIRRTSTFFLLLLIVLAYFLGLKIVSIPEEQVHFIEYGILVFLVYWALTLDIKDGRAYFWAFVIVSLLGAGDEGIQHLLPNRYYQFQDVCLNSISAALGLALIFIIRRDTFYLFDKNGR